MKHNFPWLLVPLFLLIVATSSLARDLTNQEVDKIAATLSGEKCELELAKLVDTNFEVSAACADGKSYTYVLDKEFKVLEKKPAKN